MCGRTRWLSTVPRKVICTPMSPAAPPIFQLTTIIWVRSPQRSLSTTPHYARCGREECARRRKRVAGPSPKGRGIKPTSNLLLSSELPAAELFHQAQEQTTAELAAVCRARLQERRTDQLSLRCIAFRRW